MPSSQAAAPERRNDRTPSVTHEPPKLKTPLKTPPKQATNPLQFVKVGPCSLYRTAQEQLQKVQEVKKIKQEIRDDPEDWQSNLDNWKSSRRKRQEHIIERVVEVKKLELEEHDRQRRRSKTFSEMMEERGNRGRKLSISLAMYNEEDANDLSDLGIGTSSGKSSISGDTHDDTQSVLSDRDSEIDKNHSDVDNHSHENGTDSNDNSTLSNSTSTTITAPIINTNTCLPLKNEVINNGFHKNDTASTNNHSNHQEYDSATTATASSPEPEEYTYESAIRGYVSRVSQNIPRRSLADLDAKLDNANKITAASMLDSLSKINKQEKTNGVAASPVVKVDILKRREIFENASRETIENKNNNNKSNSNNNNRLDFSSSKSIKERLSSLERQKSESEDKISKSPRHSVDSMFSVKDRFNRDKTSCEKELKTRDFVAEELEGVKPLRERLSNLEKFTSSNNDQGYSMPNQQNGELNAKTIKDRLISFDVSRCKELEKRTNNCFHEQSNNGHENSTPSERSSSPDSEYRAPRAFHQSLDSLDADASSGPDTFDRVQSLEELDYHHQPRRYPASSSSAEILNDTDREDSGIHTADASCSVSQADEPIEEEICTVMEKQLQHQVIIEEKTEFRSAIETTLVETSKNLEKVEEMFSGMLLEPESRDVVLTETGTAEIISSSSTSGEPLLLLSANTGKTEPWITNANTPFTALSPTISSRPIIYQSPPILPRSSPPETPSKPSYLPGLSTTETFSSKQEDLLRESPSVSLSSPDTSSTNTVCSINNSSDLDSRNFQLTSFSDLITSSDSISPEKIESKITSPLPSPRTPSKIPTPLPRKTIVSSPTNSTCSLASPIASCPSSPNKCPLPQSPQRRDVQPRLPTPTTATIPSEIPIPVKVANNSIPASPTSPRTSSPASPFLLDERRRTVVEVCEKVLVPRGQAQATPFITVERYADETNGSTEQPERPRELEKEALPPSAAERQQKQQQRRVAEVEEVEEEEEEEEHQPDLGRQGQEPPPASAVARMEPSLPPSPVPRLEEPELVPQPVEHQRHHQQHHPAPVRPTSLALERTSLCSDFLSPLSPVSRQQILPLSFSSDEEIVTGLPFPLGPPASVEPPKEKPPPPPVDLSDEENHPIEPLKRLNSTRRIKKELRSRRSDFLGIEGFNDEELERELGLAKPPDMATILAEERRIEQLQRRSYDTDSNYEQDSSHERDSGVELGQAEDWAKQPVSPDMSQHSRQSSEPFGASVASSSEEDEITRKEREIIEVLEREEQWRYENNRDVDSDIGEKLANKLRELEEEKMQLERERDSQDAMGNGSQRRRRQEATIETLRMNEENLRKQEEHARKEDEASAQAAAAAVRQQELNKQRAEEEHARREAEDLRTREIEELEKRSAEACKQEDPQTRSAEKSAKENKSLSPTLSMNEDEYATRELLRVKHELLELEQEELKRQRSNLSYREQKQQQLAEQLQEQWKSLQDVARAAATTTSRPQSPPVIRPRKPQAALPLNYRSSMPNLQMQETVSSLGQRRRPPPPPIPPAKPLRLVEQRQRDVTIRNSRIPSADSIPQQVEARLRSSCSTTALTNGQKIQSSQQHVQQMTRQTLQALSAVPRPRIVQADQWVQRRKSDVPRGANDYNYQHWLIQEAEQRRINEKNQRSPPGRKPHVTGTSVLYTASPPRPDSKPLPDSIIQTLTQRVQSRAQEKPLSPRRRLEHSTSQEHLHSPQNYQIQQHKVHQSPNNSETQEKMLSVSGKKKCSHCGDELGRGAAMIIESLRLFYHMECFKCCVCHVRLGDGLMGTDVRVRNHKLHCHNCYSSDDGVKFSCV